MLRLKPRGSITKLGSTLYQSSCITESDKKPRKKQPKLKKKLATLEKLQSPKPAKPLQMVQSASNLRSNRNISLKKFELPKQPDKSLARLNSPKCTSKQSNLNTSNSPASNLHRPTSKDSIKRFHHRSSASNLRPEHKLTLKYLSLNEDLELNRKVATGETVLPCKSCLENIMTLDSMKFEDKFEDFEDKFEVFNLIIRDFIGRMQIAGKSNEGVLIEKIWRHLMFSVDELIDRLKDLNVNSEDCESEDSVRKVSVLDQDVEDEFGGFDDSQVKEKVERIKGKFEFLNRVVANDWKVVNKKYLESINFVCRGLKQRVNLKSN